MSRGVGDMAIGKTTMVGMNGTSPRPHLRLRVAALGIAAALAWSGMSAAVFAAAPHQTTFASPEEAADALVAAVRANKTADLQKILGPSGRKLIFSGDRVADKQARDRFAAAYDKGHAIEKPSDATATLVVGEEKWPVPLPIVKDGDAWRFDTKAGAEEILNRRIGRNELNAMQVCGAIVDAEREYASVDRDANGHLEYASKFRSSRGKHDGLYWTAATGEQESPIGPLLARARAEGYFVGEGKQDKRSPYHGYYYKILKRQGKDAPGGAYSYVVNGHMIGGFAVIAFPATYGDSGVMTFMADKDGVLYQKNLGPRTREIAGAIAAFNPDSSWKKVQP